MNLSLPVSVISFSLEAFLMKALNDGRRKKVFSLRRHDFQQFCSWIPSVKSTTPLAIMLNSYESFRTIAYAAFILHEKDDSIYFRFRNFIDIRMNGWYRGRVIFLCRILDIGGREEFFWSVMLLRTDRGRSIREKIQIGFRFRNFCRPNGRRYLGTINRSFAENNPIRVEFRKTQQQLFDEFETGFVSASENMGNIRRLNTQNFRQSGRSQPFHFDEFRQPFAHFSIFYKVK